MSEMSQEEVLAQQKAQCPFCRIVKGEIPATKVFETAHTMAVLDINPLAKGHTVVFPKEHAPIMQMMPPEVFSDIYSNLKYIVKGVKTAAVVDSVNIFIASGGVAGQQLPHFMMHIIPREAGDGIENFSKPVATIDKSQVEQLGPALKQNLDNLMQKDKKEVAASSKAASKPEGAQQADVSEEQKKLVAQFLEAYPEKLEILKADPDKFAQFIIEDEATRAIFAGLDLKALSGRLKNA